MVARFCVYRQQKSYVNDERKQKMGTARTSCDRIKAAYWRLTRKPVEERVASEALALIEEETLNAASSNQLHAIAILSPSFQVE